MTNDIAKEKRKLAWKRRLFIASFITVPLLHFLIFTFYVNVDTFALSFQKFSNSEGRCVFVKFLNYEEFFKSFSSPGSVMGKAIVNSVLFSW